MATIRKRGKKHVVIYDYYNEKGERKQKWETFDDEQEAKIFKNKIEADKLNDDLITPSTLMLKDFLDEFVKIHSQGKWTYSTLTSNRSLIDRLITPYIGDKPLQKIKPKDIEVLLTTLRTVRVEGPKSYNKPIDEIPFLTSTSIRHVYTLLRSAFDKAVEWQYIQQSPVKCAAPEKNKTERSIWTPDILLQAFEHMKDQPLLRLAVHVAFICSARIGETLAITWDDVNFDDGYVRINKTLQRVYKDALEALPKDSHLHKIFPGQTDDAKSVLVLKSPKTESSNRRVFITAPLKLDLLARKEEIEGQKTFFEDSYTDHNLVFALETGAPIAPSLCARWFREWKAEHNEYPGICFHEIRHSSSTYKLTLSAGDYKAVQGDTGHATSDMLMNTYAHIQDKRRIQLAKKIEEDFYPTATLTSPLNISPSELSEVVMNNPEILNLILKSLSNT